MEIQIKLTDAPIAERISPPLNLGAHGAWLEFRGVVRNEENKQKISALEYEAYPEMAQREIERLLHDISARKPCLAAKVIHRVGVVPVGEAALYVGVASRHRAAAISLLGEFITRLKQDVPIWKLRALSIESGLSAQQKPGPLSTVQRVAPASGCWSLDQAVAEIQSRCQPLPAVRASLATAFGRVLRETVFAPEDLPTVDLSTRDGYAMLQDDESEKVQVVDTIHAADWKPRALQLGEAVRVATGAALPCGNLRVVMQENVTRSGDQINILKRDGSPNFRRRGEDVKAGATLVRAGVRLDAGKLALLATAGCAQPLVSPRVRVFHFTTGDEIIPPSKTPQPGQIRDSNSILIHGLLQSFSCELQHQHLPEDFATAKAEIEGRKAEILGGDLILISGGASVGDKDFTRPLLESLGFEIIFSQVNVRPGRPLIFGVDGSRVAFGLPGNPLSHFACFHFAVSAALAQLSGEAAPGNLRGRLAEALNDALCPRETLWPARIEFGQQIQLHPLPWASSGDVTCFASANALIRIPANCASIKAGAEIDFLPAGHYFAR